MAKCENCDKDYNLSYDEECPFCGGFTPYKGKIDDVRSMKCERCGKEPSEHGNPNKDDTDHYYYRTFDKEQ